MRNSIAVVSGVILSVVLNIAGSRLVWLLITGENSKDAFVRGQLWQILFVVPLVSVVVGCVVASIVARSAWWLGGIANMPLFIYAFVRDAHGIYIVLSVIYIGIAFAAAYGFSRFKRQIAPSAHVQQALGADSP